MEFYEKKLTEQAKYLQDCISILCSEFSCKSKIKRTEQINGIRATLMMLEGTLGLLQSKYKAGKCSIFVTQLVPIADKCKQCLELKEGDIK